MGILARMVTNLYFAKLQAVLRARMAASEEPLQKVASAGDEQG
jgi:hypothetical protein